MCTVVILHRPGHQWPLIMASNRDEMRDRPSLPPARHWEDRPHVIAGQDELAGGTWLGMNDDRLVACILNRVNSLGPADDKRSRGELPLEALDHAEAREAAKALSHLDTDAYRPFNMIVADVLEAYWVVYREGAERVEVERLPPGISMITAFDLNDPESERVKHHLPRFRAAPVPEPENDDWFAWAALMADRSSAPGADWSGSMAVDGVDDVNFGTVCTSLIALPSPKHLLAEDSKVTDSHKVVWKFAPGMPGTVDYLDVDPFG